MVAHAITELERRRRGVGMSCAALARRAGLSLRTVQRVLCGDEGSAEFVTVCKIAEALGASVRLEWTDPNEFRLREAQQKAARLVGMVQGTMAMEASAVERDTLDEMKQRTVRELLSGSSRKLWDK